MQRPMRDFVSESHRGEMAFFVSSEAGGGGAEYHLRTFEEILRCALGRGARQQACWIDVIDTTSSTPPGEKGGRAGRAIRKLKKRCRPRRRFGFDKSANEIRSGWLATSSPILRSRVLLDNTMTFPMTQSSKYAQMLLLSHSSSWLYDLNSPRQIKRPSRLPASLNCPDS